LFPILPHGPRVELVERLPIESPPEIAHLHATCSQSGHLDSKVFDTISEFFDTQQFQELRWIIANWYFRGRLQALAVAWASDYPLASAYLRGLLDQRQLGSRHSFLAG
jgi:hypothetical protein